MLIVAVHGIVWPHLMVRDNVAFALRRRGYGRGQCRARAQVMLERVGLGALAGRYPNQLSGGEQQRVALARARLTAVFAETRASRGEAVGLRLEPGGCHLFAG
jgi:ABC-type sulfate/molybdate transport systems ATPase subunit